LDQSIATLSLGGTLKDKLYALAAAGFRLVALTDSELIPDDLSPASLADLLRELNLRVSMFQVHGLIGTAADGSPLLVHERVPQKFDLMERLGASLIQVSLSSTLVDGKQEAAARQLAALADLAGQRGFRVAVNVPDLAAECPPIRSAWGVVRLSDRENLGISLSNFDLLASGSGLDDISEIPGERIFMASLTDVRSAGVGPFPQDRSNLCFPGQGALDVTSFVECVLDTGYRGPFSLDVLSDALRAAPVRLTAMDAIRSLRYVEESLRRGGRTGSAAILQDRGPAPIPEKESITFIEFAVAGTEQARLGTWLNALGFTLVGRHRTKSVVLYTQDDVAIILNAGSDTFARYYHQLHGLSVCALGIQVEDLQVLLDRASHYGYRRYEERTGPHEYHMPAIRAPDGSLFHLLDGKYDPTLDFAMRAEPESGSTGIRRIDHIVRAVPHGQIDSWVLFHRAFLGLVPDKTLEFVDPHGQVTSRAIHDRSDRVRLPLTTSDGNRTVVARSLTAFGGAGISQIAFESSDIYATAEKLRGAGLPILRIPANYYDELRHGRGIDPSVVDRIQALNILYDADSRGGQFLHAYSAAFDSRFFFEVVQRIGGYDRYGEINAPVRMAAQAAPVALQVPRAVRSGTGQ
jgi:4-hydroxyphenylpyruvate dioxygenase